MIVSINNTNLTDYGLILTSKVISAPSVKRTSVDIPFRDGVIDLTEALSGVPHYTNRAITMIFEMMQHFEDWEMVRSELYSMFHGKKVTVVFNDDTDYKWTGVLSVGDIEYHGFTCGITMTLDAEPFKRTISPIIEEDLNVSGTETFDITIENSRGFCRFLTDDELTVSDGVETYTLTSLISEAGGLVLTRGAQALTFKGSGAVTVTVYGGEL